MNGGYNLISVEVLTFKVNKSLHFMCLYVGLFWLLLKISGLNSELVLWCSATCKDKTKEWLVVSLVFFNHTKGKVQNLKNNVIPGIKQFRQRQYFVVDDKMC